MRFTKAGPARGVPLPLRYVMRSLEAILLEQVAAEQQTPMFYEPEVCDTWCSGSPTLE